MPVNSHDKSMRRMSMNVLVYRKCSTCMKALKWLDEHNISYEERAIKEENPTYEELKEWYAKSKYIRPTFLNIYHFIRMLHNIK